MSEHRKELIKWFNTISASGRTLDVGGKIWCVKSSLKSFEGDYNAMGKEDYDLNLDLFYPARVYDSIFCCEVMQYIYNPFNAIQNLALSLNPHGKIYMSFYRDFESFEPKNSDYLRYTKQGVYKLIEMVGLKIIDFQEPIKGYYLVTCQ